MAYRLVLVFILLSNTVKKETPKKICSFIFHCDNYPYPQSMKSIMLAFKCSDDDFVEYKCVHVNRDKTGWNKTKQKRTQTVDIFIPSLCTCYYIALCVPVCVRVCRCGYVYGSVCMCIKWFSYRKL